MGENKISPSDLGVERVSLLFRLQEGMLRLDRTEELLVLLGILEAPAAARQNSRKWHCSVTFDNNHIITLTQQKPQISNQRKVNSNKYID